ncbi:putative NACHT LRR and PYD domains-containing protein 12-like [Scophthalmus maximus]|uniref:NLR-C9 n=1 Tax=Scophthalmus maximus TaxID=52904 RepID=A0A2U9BPZ4_SCOMX|nr:NACHT, LRR and PYD domains-containing protein 14 [Scophthalmus maximus]XP_035493743.1 NACHT, LRR and PYD domains-containing protein 14 [Scophthalmus maximus]AWP06248.1 putative NACHT LRR and PYD domains-containing protein 12-like [Scophthalmus maximus]QHQ71248.1 NLR-C9 [Scophthalmus maximus]
MELQTSLKNTLKNKYQQLNEAYSKNALLPSRLCYRNLNRDYQFPNLDQQEFRYVENADLHTFKTVPLTDILSCDCKHKSRKRTVITLGVCGVGKSTTVQSCALEWAEGKGYRDIQLLFPLTFWELNLVKRLLNMIELLQTFFPGLKELDASSLNRKNVWFVLDGLDEYHCALKFNCPTVSDVSQVSTVQVLVTNLIRGTLLPNAHVWVTTGYAAAAQIPADYLLKETQVQGFSDDQKEQNFRTIIGNDDLANRAIDHVKISKSLDCLCQIPPICTIMANVLKSHLKEDQGFKFSPLNLTQIYTILVKTSKLDIFAKLKRLALCRMHKENLIYEDDLLKSDISAEEASSFSKECPLVLREEKGLHNTTVFRFGQSSIRDFLGAGATLDEIQIRSGWSSHCRLFLNEALQNDAGKGDVFLRFLFGLLKERQMLGPTNWFFDYTKKKILENVMTYRAVGLLYCLWEYDSQAFEKEIKFFLELGYTPFSDFPPLYWHFMIQRIKTLGGISDNFEMDVSTRCDQRLLRQLPAIMKSRRAMLRFSNLTDKCCPALAAVLSTRESYLRELDLGYNSITDSGVGTLVEGLNDQYCRLKTLRLQGCEVTPRGCKHLATALTQSLKLRELDLSRNEIGDDGLRHLSDGLRAPECQLETLKLSQCNIEQMGCYHLASALHANPDYLTALDLSINMVGDEGANELFKKFDISKLQKLEMYHCGLTVVSCGSIGEALKSEDSSLVELNLSNNTLKDSGFALICEGMYAWCSLEKLNVSRCGITGLGCSCMAKVLCSVSQLLSGWIKQTDWQAVELKDLDLSLNCLGDKGVKDISAGMKNPFSHLKTLNLSHCNLTDECCTELAVGFMSKESIISEVDLSENDLQDKGVRKLCVGLRNPQCKLEKLSLRSCGLTSKTIQFLISALRSNPRYLAELHLMGNSLEDSGIRLLLDLTTNDRYALHIIDVSAD